MRKTNDGQAKELKQFQLECKAYLFTLGINDLRAYGREIGVARPTTKNKDDLVKEIVLILSGELAPIEISNQGAPVKNGHVDERIPAKIKEIKRAHFLIKGKTPMQEEDIRFNAPTEIHSLNANMPQTPMTAQVVSFEEGYYAVALDYDIKKEMVYIEEEFVEGLELREGDIIQFHAQMIPREGMSVTDIMKVNDIPAINALRRPNFDKTPIYLSKERIRLFDERKYSATTLKYLEWLLPFFKGKRGCVVAPPKAGKSRLLLQVAEAASVLNPTLEVYTLLLEQAPEIIYAYQEKILKERVYYTTYDDDSERNVILANFLLNRLKRRAEMGKDILLIVDSLNVLARSFNDTEETMGGKILSNGLNEKTVRYIRKYFNGAKSLQNFGSIAILGGVSKNTGNPFDDAICAELSSQANYEIRLSDELARKHIFPAIDVMSSSVGDYDVLQNKKEQEIDMLVRAKIFPQTGGEGLLKIINNASSYEDFICKIGK